MAALLLGVAAQAMGFGQLGIWIMSTIGAVIDAILFAPDGPGDIEGPKISDRKTTAADPGSAIAIVAGQDRIAGAVIHATDLIETKHTKKVGGGKGGGSSQKQTTYTYHVDGQWMVCEGPILGIGRIWMDGKILRGPGKNAEVTPSSERFVSTSGFVATRGFNVQSGSDTCSGPYNGSFSHSLHSNDYVSSATLYRHTSIEDGQETTITPVDGGDPITVVLTGIPNSVTLNYAAWQYGAESNELPVMRAVVDGVTVRMELLNLDTLDGAPLCRQLPLGGRVAAGRVGSAGVVTGPVMDYSGARATEVGGAERVFRPASINAEVDEEGSITNHTYLVTNSTITWELDEPEPPPAGETGPFGCTSFPTRFFTNDYDPALVPWSLDPAHSSSASTARYTRETVAGDSVFTVSTDPSADLAAGKIVYWQDTVTGYYIPVPQSHASQGPTSGADSVGKTARTFDDYHNIYDVINDFSPRGYLRHRDVTDIRVFPGTDDQLQDSYFEAQIGETIPAYRGRAVIGLQRFELRNVGNRIPNLTFEVFQAGSTNPTKIVEMLLDRSTIPELQYDTTQLTYPQEACGLLIGYTIGRDTNFRAALESLVDFVGIDVAEHGNQLVFRLADRNPDVIIDYNELGAQPASSSNDPVEILPMTRRRISAMPKSLFLTFKDLVRDYNQNTANFTRQFTNATQKSTIEAPAVMLFSRAKRYCRDKMQRMWLERISFKDTLLHRYIYISPTDIVNIVGGGKDIVAKVTKITRGADGLLELSFIQRQAQIYASDEGESDDIATDDPFVGLPGLSEFPATRLELMDLPVLDADDSPTLYGAMTGPDDSWSGGFAFRSRDGGSNFEAVASTSTAAVIGDVTGDPLSTTAMAELFDRESSIFVLLHNPDEVLVSITVDQLMNFGNFAVVGNEVVQFLNAEFLGDGLYRLSGFLRGRLGTEDQIPLHVAGERFVLLDSAVLALPDAILYAGIEADWRGVTYDTLLVNSTEQTFTNNFRKLKPYAPTHIGGEWTGNDVVLQWTRRNRMYNYMRNGLGVPNSEAFEKYEVEIWDTGFTSLKNTYTVEDATTFAYDEADNIADFGSFTKPFGVKIYQLSDIIGRGLPGEAQI